MRFEKALIFSLIVHPFILILLLQTNALGVEAILHVTSPVPPDFPEVLRICSPPSIEEDVAWAAGEWNRALSSYNVKLRLESARDGCDIYVQSSNALQVPGGMVDTRPKNWTPGTTIRAEDLRFSMLEIKVIVWGAEDVKLRRGILLHEFGHVLLLTHPVDFRGIGPKPIMLESHEWGSLPESVTELDAYLAWLTHSYCKGKACPLMYVKIPNITASVAAATTISAVVAVTLTVADFGRLRKQA